ncbi:PrsW family glutamic-type intramembrane protease [Halomarina salina]|uniref:PrsW family glutamic-type intramembrane protease n=1 Tax=Halomarina salina TaxID=1872699 RepID=A0ABD5RKK2_9EURY|nr:PrsW family glutamic-type intramembrane protease [Halomarina salina]
MRGKVALDTVPTASTFSSLLQTILNDTYVRLLQAGLRYPLRSQSMGNFLLGGFLLFPMVITAVPVLGYLIEGVQRTVFEGAVRADEPGEASAVESRREVDPPFPPASHPREWLRLGVVGLKGVVISAVCIVWPFAVVSSTVAGPLESSLVGTVESGVAGLGVVAGLVGAVVLLYFYPAVLGNFIESGNLRHSIRSVNDGGNLTAIEYRRGVAAVLTIVVGGVLFFWFLYDLLGVVALAFVGPVAFYTLLASHFVIGEIRNHLGVDTTASARTSGHQADDVVRGDPSPPTVLVKLVHLLSPERRTDPVATRHADRPDVDLYGVTFWEHRTRLDGLSVRLYRSLKRDHTWWLLLFFGAGSLAQMSYWVRETTAAGTDVVYVLVSWLPALVVALFIALRFGARPLPVRGLVGAVVLGAVASPWAWAINDQFRPLTGRGLIGRTLYFYGPTAVAVLGVSLLVLLLYAYSDRLTSVVDGAVYGAAVGLGHIMIENLNMVLSNPQFGSTIEVVAEQRAMVGPLAVVLMALLGYYVGLARFNPDRAGPIVVKGLLICIFLRGTYDVLYLTGYDLVVQNYRAISQSPVYTSLGDALPPVLWSEVPTLNEQRLFFVVAVSTVFAVTYLTLRRYRRFAREDVATAEEDDESETSTERPERKAVTTAYVEHAQVLLDAGMLTPEEFDSITRRL